MKKMYFILTGLLCPLISAAQTGNFQLTVAMSGVKPGLKAYLAYQYDGNKVIDSAISNQNMITFTGSVLRPLRASLILDDQQLGLATLLKTRGGLNMLKLYIYPGKIKGNTGSRLADTRFAARTLNADFQMYQKGLQEFWDKQDTLGKRLTAEKDTVKREQLKSAYTNLSKSRLATIKAFVAAYPESYMSLVAWQEYTGYLRKLDDRRQLNPERLTDSKSLFNVLSPDVRNSVEGKASALLFVNDQLLKPGAMAPDFAQPDVSGKMVRLSDFKGKYVLLDFWASWCGPCRKSNPELVRLYQQYKNRNFTILGISLDDKEGRNSWLKAIKDDGLTWKQVSDLQHWDNQVVRLYNISAIPQNMLIGPDGKMIANSPDIDELKQILNKVLPSLR